MRHRLLPPVLFLVLTVLGLAMSVSTAAAQSGDPVSPEDTFGTTSTLPVDSRQLGDMIPKPNTGMEPQSAGDPGGWLQVSLFFLICAAIVVIGLAVWWSSRRARARRAAAGLDPVSLARARGEGVRGPGAGAGAGAGSADAS